VLVCDVVVAVEAEAELDAPPEVAGADEVAEAPPPPHPVRATAVTPAANSALSEA
jgi:hypothetical protein